MAQIADRSYSARGEVFVLKSIPILVCCFAVTYSSADSQSATPPLVRPHGTQLELKTSDTALAGAFEWARRQALAYAFSGDPVGDWYEAALPGRQAFCMRDTAHQSMGAHMLGLADHTRNMLHKFAENISESKDWCSYWEINRDNLPAPIDYLDDAHFWYNLPVNFDVLDACYRMYVWTGDQRYITDPVFQSFYRRTVHDYVERWDLGVDRIMRRQRILNVRGRYDPTNRFQKNRGIPSYDEGDPNFVVALDQLAVQYAGYFAYSHLRQLKGDEGEAEAFLGRARELKSFLNRVWWDAKTENYFSRLNLAHQLERHGPNLSVLYYDAAERGPKSLSVLKELLRAINEKSPVEVEGQSHFPEILYRYGQSDAAYGQIIDLTREGKNRREYPEVSYAVIGAIATGLMGIELEAPEADKAVSNSPHVNGAIVTIPRLTNATAWAELDYVPVRANEVNVRHEGLTQTTTENVKGPSLVWRPCFPGSINTLLVDGRAVRATHDKTVADRVLSCADVILSSGEKKMAQVSP
jgi:hypothetical protein